MKEARRRGLLSLLALLFALVLPGAATAAPAGDGPPPSWGEKEIRASRRVPADAGKPPGFAADRLPLVVVLERGGPHISVLDGEGLEPVFRLPVRPGVLDGPRFSPDGRFAYVLARDGWIAKFDLWNGSLAAEVRAGIETADAAVSADGKLLAVANLVPANIVFLDGDLNPVRILPAADLRGKSSRVSAIRDTGPRKSFVAALAEVKEAWEISYDPKAEPVFDGLVHDYRMGEGISRPGFLNPRRIPLEGYLEGFLVGGDFRHIIATARDEGEKKMRGLVINLDVRRKVADLDLPGTPHPPGGCAWTRRGQAVLAIPNRSEAVVSIVAPPTWKTLRNIATPGPGFFPRCPESGAQVWLDAPGSREHGDTLLVLDKDSLEVVASLKPAPGKALGPVAFTRDGRHLLASVNESREEGGAIIVFATATLKEVKRIPMDRPAGAYTIGNRLNPTQGGSR